MTAKQLKQAIELVENRGYSAKAAATEVNAPYNQVVYYLHKSGINWKKKWSEEMKAHYAVYDKKTDELLAIGTGEEICKQMGWKIESLYCYVSRGLKGMDVIRIKEDDNE